MGSSGERVAVSVVAGFRAQVEQAYREFAAAGLPLSSVTAAPVALTDYYAFQRAEQNHTAGLCYVDGDRECLTVACDGLMVSTVHFDPGAETRTERLLRELERVAPEKTGELLEIVAEAPSTDEKSFASVAAEAPFAVVGPPENWLEAAAIGAALAVLGEARHRTNLLPPEMAKAEQGVGIRELALGAAVVTLALALMGSTAVKNLSVNNALAAEVARLAPKVSQVSRQEEENRKLLAQIDLIEKDRARSVLAYLQAMTDAIPKTAYLTTFRYKGDRIEADGIAESASGLIGVLEKSPFFKNVEFTAPTTKYLQSQERFSLRMELER
jgi:Tfp pilus assembly protein PilN